ncbi:hypothetical protein NE852_04825 [Rhizobium sp. Pop5]|uniref:hypothetical protein n=1 Tax=Rhizobium sp. Pop5 TaxID=1223565 RepID=UPI000283CC5B|nr:hypothetical protein [Rhizobium sp. Pop5]EJZ20371.1 hypothetical protein RCCGEPOP_15491 [Rhizobium sp. Pop5]UVD57530.1 hypothetical protein NE852_04825 [Rhizobium sp. Pop5]
MQALAYHITSIPPMPPGIAGASFFGSSAIMASVVTLNGVITEEEKVAVDALGRMLEGISNETRHFQSEAEYIQSGCAMRIRPVAQNALKAFLSVVGFPRIKKNSLQASRNQTLG